MGFFPEGVQVWGYAREIRFFRQLTVQFDIEQLRASVGEDFVGRMTFEPKLRVWAPRAWQLCQMLSEECPETDELSQLSGDGLVLALYAELVRMHSGTPRPMQLGGMAKAKLTRVIDFIESNWNERIELTQLAALSGLSQSQFCRAFRESTGLPPHRWHLRARIRRAQELLIDGNSSLVQIALATGFADQSHFTRVFRTLIGTTPAVWLRTRAPIMTR